MAMPSRYWESLHTFVERGGKLIMDGLTAYYDEHAHCIMKHDFPLADLCGAYMKEFKLNGNLFDIVIDDEYNPSLPTAGREHCTVKQRNLLLIEGKRSSPAGTALVRVKCYGSQVWWD